jgi:arylsulfatase A
MKRRDFLSAAAAIAAGAAQARPNIVLIVADDLGFGHLGCYGQTRIRTPHLDQMAAEGTRFTQFYAGCSVCAPSRASLMTGLHTGHAPVRSNSGDVPLLPGERTMAEELQALGYRTGMFGKWGLGDAGSTGVPDRKGFNEYYGYLHQVHAHFHYPHFLWKNGKKVFLANRHAWRRKFAHDAIETEALTFIRNSGGSPFFAYLPFTLPHAELLAPDDAMAEYEGKFPETPFTSAPRFHYAPNPTPRAALAAMVTRLDRSVGRVLALLGEMGIDKNTLVLFTSDNGPDHLNGNDIDFFQAAGPLRGRKSMMYEGGLRVPLIARWPGQVPVREDRETVGAFWDLMPTCLDAAGAASPGKLDGASLLSAFRGKPQPSLSSRELYWERDETGGILQAARLGDWKAVRPSGKAPLQVFDLRQDLAEERDLSKGRPDLTARFEAFMRSAHTEPRPQTAERPPDGKQYQ